MAPAGLPRAGGALNGSVHGRVNSRARSVSCRALFGKVSTRGTGRAGGGEARARDRLCACSALPAQSTRVSFDARPRRNDRPTNLAPSLDTQSTATQSAAVATRDARSGPSSSAQQAELAVLDALRTARGRGREGLSPDAVQRLNLAIAALEADGGVAGPAALPEVIDGKWRLLYTSRPGSASPIQRAFTGVESFRIYQEIALGGGGSGSGSTGDGGDTPRVNNIVDFGPKVGYLIVQAEASTDARPLPGFTPRRGEGLPFGIMGRSFNKPPSRPDSRIDFQFDRAAFHFNFLPFPFTIPYPVVSWGSYI